MVDHAWVAPYLNYLEVALARRIMAIAPAAPSPVGRASDYPRHEVCAGQEEQLTSRRRAASRRLARAHQTSRVAAEFARHNEHIFLITVLACGPRANM